MKIVLYRVFTHHPRITTYAISSYAVIFVLGQDHVFLRFIILFVHQFMAKEPDPAPA